MLTDSELDAIRMRTIEGSENIFSTSRSEYYPWIGRLIRTEADARLLLPPIKLNLYEDELVDFKDGTKSTRLDRIDFLLQYWDEASQIDRLDEAGDLLEYLAEVEKDDNDSWERYQLAHIGLDALCFAVGERMREHQKAIQPLPVSDHIGESISPP